MKRVRTYLSLLCCIACVLRADPAPWAVQGELDLRGEETVLLRAQLSMELIDRMLPRNRKEDAFMRAVEFGRLQERLIPLLESRIILFDHDQVKIPAEITAELMRVDDISTPDLMLVEGGILEVELRYSLQQGQVAGSLQWELLSAPYLTPMQQVEAETRDREALVTVWTNDGFKRLLRFDRNRNQLDLELEFGQAVKAGPGGNHFFYVREVSILLLVVLIFRFKGHRMRGVLLALLAVVAGSYLIVRPMPEKEDIQGLLEGVYHSFDAETERLRYRQLEAVVHPDLVETVYLEIEDALRDWVRGISRMQVTEVTIEELRTAPGTEQELEWTVDGYIGHWGHLHRRRVACRARVRAVQAKGRWLIRGFDVIEQQGVDLE